MHRLVTVMEDAEKSLGRMKDLGDDIGRLRDQVERVITKTTEVADGLRPKLAAVRSQIDKLGPPPAKDAPAEAAPVAAQRARLNSEASALDGAIKTLELTWVRARQTIDKITDLRLAIFTRSIMERMASPLLPGLWSDVTRDAPQVARLSSYIWTDWWASATRRAGGLAAVLIGTAILYLALKLLVRRLMALSRPPAGHVPTFFERAAAAAWVAPLRALPVIAAAFAVYGGLDAVGLLYYPSQMIAAAILRAVMIYVPVAALLTTVLSPRKPEHRLVSLTDTGAARLCRYFKAMAAIYAADLALTSIGRALYFPLSMSVVQSLVASLAFAGLLAGVLLTPFAPFGTPDAGTSRLRPRWLKLPLWVAVIAIIGACALGYVALARFAAQQLGMSGVIGLVTTLLFLAIRAFTQPSETPNAFGAVLEQRFGLDAGRRQQLARLTEFALSISLAILALPILLLQWGFSGADIRDWLKAALFGFEVGHFRISLARILIGVVLFTALLFVTRIVQRWLRELVLSPARMEVGLANSIDTGVGYVGTTIAALLAISYAGVDITNLAIVAGALSVGIGFGLQSIVNNFVSGLILLVERPVKVGDWIVVKDQEGYVRRISVRSTEIETFDKASVIVPNSELITGVVKNWTHRNALGRVSIKVRASYKADPEAVRAMLLEIAARNPLVLKHLEPSVTLDNLGDTALEFSMRAIISDVNQASSVQSALRSEILNVFRHAGISVPAPEADGAAAASSSALQVRVRASYKADPEDMQVLLAQVTDSRPEIAREPRPRVSFDNMGDNGLEFSVRANAADGIEAQLAESALRTAIVKAMREAGIEIPHPQTDVHLRDLDAVRSILTKVAQERFKGVNGQDAGVPDGSTKS